MAELEFKAGYISSTTDPLGRVRDLGLLSPEHSQQLHALSHMIWCGRCCSLLMQLLALSQPHHELLLEHELLW